MKCPKCKSATKVCDKRTWTEEAIRRRRECKRCQYRFTTVEVFKAEDLRKV